jgi:hypothetical protein
MNFRVKAFEKLKCITCGMRDEMKKTFGRPGRRWEGHIKIEL